MDMSSALIKAVLLSSLLVESAFATPLPSPYTISPYTTAGFGNSARNLFGSFRENGGSEQYRYFIGTNGGPGGFTMEFARPFTDGAGFDFAILTNSQSWGPLGDVALFEFFLGEVLQGSFSAILAPDQLFEFDLPGSGLVADRVRVTNMSTDPPGINNLATMTFDNAGVAYSAVPVSGIPEPSSIALVTLGLVCFRLFSWRHRRTLS